MEDRVTQVALQSSAVAYPDRLPPPRSRPELSALIVENINPKEIDLKKQSMPFTPPRTQGPMLSPLSADAQLDQMLKENTRGRSRKSMSGGVRPAQARSHSRKAMISEAKPEMHEIQSSEEDMPAIQDGDFAMVTP